MTEMHRRTLELKDKKYTAKIFREKDGYRAQLNNENDEPCGLQTFMRDSASLDSIDAEVIECLIECVKSANENWLRRFKRLQK